MKIRALLLGSAMAAVQCNEIFDKDSKKEQMCQENVRLRDQLINSNKKLDELKCLLYGDRVKGDCKKGILMDVKHWFELDRKTKFWKIFNEIKGKEKKKVAKNMFKNRRIGKLRCKNK